VLFSLIVASSHEPAQAGKQAVRMGLGVCNNMSTKHSTTGSTADCSTGSRGTLINIYGRWLLPTVANSLASVDTDWQLNCSSMVVGYSRNAPLKLQNPVTHTLSDL
jgi:hypothetical protein